MPKHTTGRHPSLAPPSVTIAGQACLIDAARRRVAPLVAGGQDPAWPPPAPSAEPKPEPIDPAAAPAPAPAPEPVQQTQGPAVPGAEPPPTPAPAPQYVTTEGLKQFGEQLTAGFSSTVERMMGGFAEAVRPAPAAPQPVQGPSQQDVQAALEGGDYARATALMEQRTTAAVTNAVNDVRRNEIEPMRTTGMASISQLALNSIRSRPYYADYKQEIEGAVAYLAQQGAATPDNIERAYKLTLGEHVDEIREKEKAQWARDLAAASAPAPTPAAGADGRAGAAAPPVTSETAFSPETHAALREVGRPIERVWRGLGYDSEEAYLADVRQYGGLQ